MPQVAILPDKTVLYKHDASTSYYYYCAVCGRTPSWYWYHSNHASPGSPYFRRNARRGSFCDAHLPDEFAAAVGVYYFVVDEDYNK